MLRSRGWDDNGMRGWYAAGCECKQILRKSAARPTVTLVSIRVDKRWVCEHQEPHHLSATEAIKFGR